MQTLNLYKERSYNQVKLFDKLENKLMTFKIPNEFTVEEVERLLEAELMRTELEKTEVAKDKIGRDIQLTNFHKVTFEQLEMLFQHFHPEMTGERLRMSISYKDALEILDFYQKYRFQGKPGALGSKKKL